MNRDAYIQGFLDKCAQQQVDPGALLQQKHQQQTARQKEDQAKEQQTAMEQEQRVLQPMGTPISKQAVLQLQRPEKAIKQVHQFLSMRQPKAYRPMPMPKQDGSAAMAPQSSVA